MAFQYRIGAAVLIALSVYGGSGVAGPRWTPIGGSDLAQIGVVTTSVLGDAGGHPGGMTAPGAPGGGQASGADADSDLQALQTKVQELAAKSDVTVADMSALASDSKAIETAGGGIKADDLNAVLSSLATAVAGGADTSQAQSDFNALFADSKVDQDAIDKTFADLVQTIQDSNITTTDLTDFATAVSALPKPGDAMQDPGFGGGPGGFNFNGAGPQGDALTASLAKAGVTAAPTDQQGSDAGATAPGGGYGGARGGFRSESPRRFPGRGGFGAGSGGRPGSRANLSTAALGRGPYQAASPQLANSPLMRGQRSALSRREALILQSLINHPWLLHDHLEEIAGLELAHPDAVKLRAGIIAAFANYGATDDPEAERERIAAWLQKNNYSEQIQRVEKSLTTKDVWGSQAGAAREDVLSTWQQLVALHRQSHALLRELKDAEQAVGHDNTEANNAWLRDVKARLAAADGTEALIEGFGESSGRFRA